MTRNIETSAFDLTKKTLSLLIETLSVLQNKFRVRLTEIKNNLLIGRGVTIIGLSNLNIGKKVTIAHGAILDCGGQSWCNYKGGIKIGSNSYIGYNSVLIGGEEIKIGEKVLISPGTVITTQGHFFQDTRKFIKEQPTQFGKIIIEDDVWVGSNCCILPGVTIGKGSVIGAGAVVNRDIPSYSIAVGIPAKVIKTRGKCDEIKE
jgi:acetyltransferase-like isoleucine patch superfamily enzyme